MPCEVELSEQKTFRTLIVSGAFLIFVLLTLHSMYCRAQLETCKKTLADPAVPETSKVLMANSSTCR